MRGVPGEPPDAFREQPERVRGRCPRSALETRIGVTAFARADVDVMRERIGAGGRDIGVGREIPDSVEKRIGATSLPRALTDEMSERVDAGRDVGIGRKIPLRIEDRIWIAPLGRPAAKEVHQRIEPDRGDIGVGGEIPVRIEERAWVASLDAAAKQKMQQRIATSGSNVLVVHEVPSAIEQAGRGDQALLASDPDPIEQPPKGSHFYPACAIRMRHALRTAAALVPWE